MSSMGQTVHISTVIIFEHVPHLASLTLFRPSLFHKGSDPKSECDCRETIH